MTTLNGSSGASTSMFARRLYRGCGVISLLIASLSAGWAQNSSLGIQMVPVTVNVPQLQLTAPLGSTNALEVSTNLTAWQDVATLTFTTTNLLWLDLYPRGGAAYYRMRRISGTGGTTPPFPPPLTNLVWISPGQFDLGSPDGAQDAAGDELSQTAVTLTKGFFMGKFEVTQAEYLAVVGANPSFFTGDPRLPVESITWAQATNFCRLLNISEAQANRLPAGYAYRLPTEAEWEYAARAGSTNRFNWGNDPTYSALGNYAWYSANSGGGTHPVGQKLPNSWGLYDVSGNVSEWCQDWYLDPYPGGTITDPQGPASGAGKLFRGGSHADEPASCRPAARNSINITTALNIFGLRVVLAQTP